MATPASTPHTDGVLNVREGHGRVTSWKGGRTPVNAWTIDGDGGRLQNGEGWTPLYIHQSILIMHTICHRALVSEVLTSPAIERACLDTSGEG